MNNERAGTEMLVRAESVSDRSVLPASLRTEQVQAASEDVSDAKRRHAQYQLGYYRANREKINKQRRKRNADWMKRWREKNPQKSKKRKRDWYKKHPETFKKWYRENYDSHVKTVLRWQKNNPEKVLKYREKSKPTQRRLNAASVASLRDSYVRAKLSRNSSMAPHQWPASVVELKRAELKLKRHLKLWQNQKT